MPVRGKTTEKTTTTKTENREVVKQNALEKKVLKYLSTIYNNIEEIINEKKVVKVSNNGTTKEVVFITFSPKGKDDEFVDNEFNQKVIKDILFGYLTNDSSNTEFTYIISVLPEKDNIPNILSIEEYKVS